MTNRLTATLGLRYDVEIIPVPERNNPTSRARTTTRSTRTTSSRASASPTRSTRAHVQLLRGGYGRFYDKTHFEIINGIFNAGVFSDSFTVNFPASAADAGPRNGQFPTDPMLVNGPVLNRALLNRAVSAWQHAARTPATSRSTIPSRRIPRSDQLSVGLRASARRHVLGERRLRPRVRSRDVHDVRREQGHARHHRLDLSDRPTGPRLPAGQHVPERRRDRLRRAPAAGRKAAVTRLQRARLVHLSSMPAATPAATDRRRCNFQVGQDMNLDLNDGPTDFDPPAQFRDQRPDARALHARDDVQLGGAGLERAAVQSDEQPDRCRS